MVTRLKILTEEPEYKILKNRNFRNNQNYIVSNNVFLLIRTLFFDKKERILLHKIYGLYIFILIIAIFSFIYSYNIIYILFIFLFPLPGFMILTILKQYFLQKSRIKKYIPIKIHYNKNYYIFLNRFSGGIIKKFYR